MTSLPASDPGSAAVWGSKRINPRPQSCLCLTWSGYLSNDDDDDVYVRYCWESEMIEDFLFCHAMPTRTTGEEVFKVLDSFLLQSGLLWSQCIGICTDGAASMTGIHSGVVGRVKKVAPNITATHCMIHREALVAKKNGCFFI